MSIASDLTAVATNLNSALDEINTKIEAKGGTASETVYGVAAAVENLPSGGETTSPNIIKAGTGNPSPIQLSDGSWFLPSSDSYNWGKLRSSATTDISFNPSQSQIRYVVKYKQTSSFTNWGRIISGIDSNDALPILGINPTTRKVYAQIKTPSSQYPSVYANYEPALNTWYYACLYFSANNLCCSMYDESGTLLAAGMVSVTDIINQTSSMGLGGHRSSYDFLKNSEIDLSETFVELNGTIIWGKANSKTQNMGIFDFTDFSEFTQVEYIEATGTQYIDTKFIPSGNMEFECKIKDVNSLTEGCFFGCENRDYSSKFSFLTYNNNIILNYGSSGSGAVPCATDTEYVCSYRNSVLNINGNTQNKTGTLSLNFSMYIFACGGDFPRKSSCKLEYLKLWKDGNLIFDFVPCYHTATGVIGMFDLVNNKFYMNAGTGTFLKGADVNA